MEQAQGLYRRVVARPLALFVGQPAHLGRHLDLDEVVAATRTHPLTADLLERAVVQWRCWLDY